jgi:DNA-binding NarL/FixJ family response regulator
MTIRVLLVNEQPILFVGVRETLAQAEDIELVGGTFDGREAIEQVVSLQPDVVLLACNMPDCPGVMVADQITQMELPARVLAYSRDTDDQQVKAMLAAGAMGYALTTEEPDTLIAAIHAVAAGQVWLSPRLVVQTFTRIDRELETIEPLTEKEQEILSLIGRGLQNREIAEALALEWQTVKNYVSRLYKKLGVNSRPQAILRAIRLGMVDIERGKGKG